MQAGRSPMPHSGPPGISTFGISDGAVHLGATVVVVVVSVLTVETEVLDRVSDILHIVIIQPSYVIGVVVVLTSVVTG